MIRRGLTLLELLIALAVLLTIGGIVLPSMVRVLAEREFESAGDVVVNHLLLARSHAQSSGEMVEVRFIAEPPHLEARRFDPAASIDESQDFLFAPDDERAVESVSQPAFSIGEDERELIIARGWAQRALPGDVRITRTQPERDDLFYDEAYADEAFVPFPGEMDDAYAPPEMEEEEPAFIRVAVFLPDGSALLADPVWLVDEHDRAAKLTVNPWTGLAALERIEDLIGDDAALEKEPEEEHDETEEMLEDAETFDAEPPATPNEASGNSASESGSAGDADADDAGRDADEDESQQGEDT